MGDADGFQPIVTGFETLMGNQMKVAGCYYCLKVFQLKEVTKFIDDGETMLCPYCGVDAVLDGVNCSAVLRRQHKKWFSTAMNERGESVNE